VIASPGDLDQLHVLQGDEAPFDRQLELIRRLAEKYAGQVLMATTVFNSWTTLRNLTAPETDQHGPPTPLNEQDPRDRVLSRLLREAPSALARALEVIAESSANFVRHALAAGADGIYLSVRDDWVDTPENGAGTYARLVQPTDLKILAGAAKGTFNILHICGRALDFLRFAAYPATVLNWADRVEGPSIAAVAGQVRPTLCAGLDHLGTLATGSPEDCANQARDALSQAAGRPILISPGCTYDPQAVPAANLHAVRRALS
jgi:uroporphyrinogen-III decarboxylase